jgi:hypothetical protein
MEDEHRQRIVGLALLHLYRVSFLGAPNGAVEADESKDKDEKEEDADDEHRFMSTSPLEYHSSQIAAK